MIIRNACLEPEVLFPLQITMTAARRGHGALIHQQQLGTGSAPCLSLPAGLGRGASRCIRCGTEGEGRMEVQALPQRAVGLRRAPGPVAMPLLYEVQCCGSVSSQQSVSQFIFL